MAIEAFALVQKRVANCEFHIYGGGDEKTALIALAEKLGLNGKVKIPTALRWRPSPT